MIRPHRHRALCQMFWINRGSGVALGPMEAEQPFRAPVLIVVPSGRIHGFRYTPGSDGYVVSLTDAFLAQCRRLGADGVVPGDVALLPSREDATAQEMNAAFGRVERAFRMVGPERTAALSGHALLLLALVRQGAEERAAARPGAGRVLLVRRFQEDIEAHYTEHAGLQACCDRLGVTQSTLTRACREIAGMPPAEMIHERLMTEARRMLILGTRNVSGVAYALGFEPAYFSRFFTAREGISPAVFRSRHYE